MSATYWIYDLLKAGAAASTVVATLFDTPYNFTAVYWWKEVMVHVLRFLTHTRPQQAVVLFSATGRRRMRQLGLGSEIWINAK